MRSMVEGARAAMKLALATALNWSRGASSTALSAVPLPSAKHPFALRAWGPLLGFARFAALRMGG